MKHQNSSSLLVMVVITSDVSSSKPLFNSRLSLCSIFKTSHSASKHLMSVFDIRVGSQLVT